MAPVKFDDIAKVSKEVLDDDYVTNVYTMKTKMKTSWNSSVVSSQMDLFGKDECKTPAKLTWKIPAPFGISAISIDKFEVDKKGELFLDLSSDKLYPGLKFEGKSDPKDITTTLTFTGIKDTLLKAGTKFSAPADFTCEVMRTQGMATFGVKATSATLTSPDVGIRVADKNFFFSLVGKDKFSTFVTSCYFKPSDVLKCAANYTHGGKQNGNFSVGMTYQARPNLTVKAKVQQDMSVSVSKKYTVAKGFTVSSGVKYDTQKGTQSTGFQVSIE
eukprot:TRINITY_DN9395_c0_g1_i1.p1 TRINITY_DN9395_c0_g1~~TRINITY_DN9395_c0_g1_i1.p1  ORF type:complete len:273 (-),score=73.40 TRINITY_DN9395_c0_g1_i1:71-889(-)